MVRTAFAGRPGLLKSRHRRTLAQRASAVTPRELGMVLSYHCGSDAYLRATRPGAPRYDLDGNEAGSVTEDLATTQLVLLSSSAAQQMSPVSMAIVIGGTPVLITNVTFVVRPDWHRPAS